MTVTPAQTNPIDKAIQPVVRKVEAIAQRWLLHATGQAFVIFTAATHSVNKWEAIGASAGSALLATAIKALQRRFGTSS